MRFLWFLGFLVLSMLVPVGLAQAGDQLGWGADEFIQARLKKCPPLKPDQIDRKQ